MSQVAAIFLDGYRELNSRKLFWFTLVLTGLAVAAVGVPYINEHGFYLLWWKVSSGTGASETLAADRAKLYRALFQMLGINIWLTWVATGLALVSTAGIFPDLITSGSIDLVLSKPIGRLRLFFTKYATGLIFVALQVSVFCVACFFVMGVRGGVWQPAVFIAVPLVVLFYSYLFSLCVLVGLITRSTIAALIITIILWVMLGLVNYTDWFAGLNRLMHESAIRRLEPVILQAPPRAQSRPAFQRLVRDLQDSRDMLKVWKTVETACMIAKAPFPKTSETVDLLSRALVSEEELKQADRQSRAQALNVEQEYMADEPPPPMEVHGATGQGAPLPPDAATQPGTTQPAPQNTPATAPDFHEHGPRGMRARQMGPDRQAIEEIVKGRSLWWTIGTSLAFEAAMLALAAWIFCRRDY